MANKKIRVGIANESLTPEEEHQIEVKVDEMMAIETPEKSGELESDGSAASSDGKDITIPLPDTVEIPAEDLSLEPKAAKAPTKRSSKKKIAVTHHEETAQNLPDSDDRPDDVEAVAETEADDDGVPPPETVLNLDETPKPQKSGNKIEITSADSAAESIAVKPAGPPPLPGAETAEPESTVAVEPELPVPVEPAEPKIAKSIEIKHVSSETTEPSQPETTEDAGPEPEPTPGKHKEIVIQPPKDEPSPEPKKTPGPEPKKEISKPNEEVSLDEPLIEPPVKRKHAVPKDTDFELLAQSEAIAKAFESKGSSPLAKFRKRLAGLFRTKKARWLTIVGLLVAVLVVIGALPFTRSMVGNLVGLRGSATVRVIDAITRQPLQGAKVTLGGAMDVTDDNGAARLHRVKLGNQQLTVQRVAYDAVRQPVFISIGGQAKSDVALTTNGIRYSFKVTDYLSGQAIAGARVSSGQASAVTDNNGAVTLAIPKPLDGPSFSVSANGYRVTKIQAGLDNSQPLTAALVSVYPDIYVSNQSGKYDIYKVDVDGQNRQLVLAGTGNENDQLALLINSDSREVALVSTRDNVRDKDGYLLQTLSVTNTVNGSTVTVDHSEKIQAIDWLGDKLVYVEAKAGASAANPSRYRLMSYSYATKKNIELDHANYFNDVVSAGGAIYYATSNTYSGGISQFIKINADGSDKQVLLTNEVWNIFRTNHDDFMLDTPTSWYSFKLGDAKPAKAASGYSGTSRLYVDSPGVDRAHSVWVDTRDGKGALVLYDALAKKDKVLVQQDGLTYPARWLNTKVLIYRVKNASETADYAVSIDGGSPKKITDVTNSAGMTLWYYY